MGRDLAELAKRLEQLCDQAASEADRDKRDKLTEEIWRVLDEKQKLTDGSGSIPAFYVRRKATHSRSGETSFSSLGPFPTYEEAQAKQREDEAARVEPEYEYEYRIVGSLEGNPAKGPCG